LPRSSKLEDALDRLARVRQDPSSHESLTELRAALAARSPHLAAKAATIVGELQIDALSPDLVAAFERFLVNPSKSDPGCAAKTAIVDALQRLSAPEPSVYLRGIRAVQMEPAWGGQVDTAVALRGVSAFGLVSMGYPYALTPLAELLADPDARARAAAARALAHSEDAAAVPVLRLKALIGDEDAEVHSECLSALLSIDPTESIAFVGRLLDSPTEQARELAALALGGSRRKEAFPVLRQWWESRKDDSSRRTALLAIAMLKREEALDFLLDLVAAAPGPTARLAIAALAFHRYDDVLVQRVKDAAVRDDADLSKALADEFG